MIASFAPRDRLSAINFRLNLKLTEPSGLSWQPTAGDNHDSRPSRLTQHPPLSTVCFVVLERSGVITGSTRALVEPCRASDGIRGPRAITP